MNGNIDKWLIVIIHVMIATCEILIVLVLLLAMFGIEF